MPSAIYTYPIKTSFVLQDQRLLARHFFVRNFYFPAAQKSQTPIILMRQLFFVFWYGWRARFFVSHFSGYHTLIPSIFGYLTGKPHFIILNGTECNNFPEFGYGYLHRPLLYKASSISLRMASHLLPVSQSLVRAVYSYMPTQYPVQGIEVFYPKVKTPAIVIPNGIDTSVFNLNAGVSRKNGSFITVATGLHDRHRRAIKGVDLFLELAQAMPEYTFTIAGGTLDPSMAIPPNLKCLPHLSETELVRAFRQHAFYIQVSVSEGFGIALCEAMLCGCVPIVSNVGVLPELASPFPYVVEKREIGTLVAVATQALQAYDPAFCALAHTHIAEHYPLARREREILAVLPAAKKHP